MLHKNTYNFTAEEMLALRMEKRTTCWNGARSSPREGFQFEIINTTSDRSHLASELTLGSVERQTTEYHMSFEVPAISDLRKLEQ